MFQPDGNLVLYRPGYTSVAWAGGTADICPMAYERRSRPVQILTASIAIVVGVTMVVVGAVWLV
jgi:hypothetical protein